MAWFDVVKDTAAKTAKIAKSKSGELYEITKLSISINEIESKIDKLFKNVGILAYRDYENGAVVSEDIAEIIQDIDSKFREVEELKNKINELKSVSACPKCEATNPKGANFCQNCGEVLIQK